jgi:hypothetical protein
MIHHPVQHTSMPSNVITLSPIAFTCTPSVSEQKLRLDIICVTKQKVRLVKFLSNFVKRSEMLPKTMEMLLLMNYQVNQLTIYTYFIIDI